MKYLASSAHSLSIVQLLSVILTIIGFNYFDFNLVNCSLIFLGYFIFSGLGVSMTLHRYYSHKSFEFRYTWLKWLFTIVAVLAGRGSPVGWAYIHRLHHKFSDTDKDPHGAKTVGWKIIFPSLVENYKDPIDKKVIKDFMNKPHILISRYYMGFIILWSVLLLILSPAIFYFLYVIPVFLTFVSLDLFVLLTHKYVYISHSTTDNSKNNWFISLILWGEGWHNNHHNNPRKWNLKENWWEIDLLSYCIMLVKK